ncbi:SOUL family heme-binding protein [Rickettsiales endosymbiont of Stachyamoeba lipophora]|uniref:SOUL family heme-binding protein n=1 Tax=Rickettsiales endosymbiont of Stachyamoeba lipophora TaxID=2486578 RepID=UPI000F650B56|nr:heme-binding protein [Rickettsiales endosymbiont of Stachyamoeba lipophora]AZL15479.1 heme-binding protein [Rickettsiales endosymbiont of Stachyamoeba lipophora]
MRVQVNNATFFIVITIVILLISLGSFALMISHVEQPKYIVVKSLNDIEIRKYQPLIIAEVNITSERKDALIQGYDLLSDYILGNNQEKVAIEMTLPVAQQIGDRYLNAVDIFTENPNKVWAIRFMIPQKYQFELLPKPLDERIKLFELSERDMVAIKFNGINNDENFLAQLQKLENFVQQQNIQTQGAPIFIFYDPLWTTNKIKRNEILIELAHSSEQ